MHEQPDLFMLAYRLRWRSSRVGGKSGLNLHLRWEPSQLKEKEHLKRRNWQALTELTAVQQSFQQASNPATEMAMASFPDGSYLKAHRPGDLAEGKSE